MDTSGVLHHPIPTWEESERPREKFSRKGPDYLSDAELLAILIGTGTRKRTAIDLARQLLIEFGGLDNLARSSIEQQLVVSGIGYAKAIRIAAAFELCRRRASSVALPERVSCSQQVADYLIPKLGDLGREVLMVMFLNANNEILGEKIVSSGGVSQTVADPRVIFQEALKHPTHSIILSHNHLSYNTRPSDQDIGFTRNMVLLSRSMGIRIWDHIIIGRAGYFSFHDDGLLKKLERQTGHSDEKN